MSGFKIQAPTFLSRLFVPDEWRAFRKPAVVDQRVGFFLDGVSSGWTRDSPPLNGPLMVIRAGSLLRRTWRGISEEQVIHRGVKALLYLFVFYFSMEKFHFHTYVKNKKQTNNKRNPRLYLLKTNGKGWGRRQFGDDWCKFAGTNFTSQTMWANKRNRFHYQPIVN